MATSTKTRHRRTGGRPADTRPRKSDRGVPDDLERRARAGEQGYGSVSDVEAADLRGYAEGVEAGRQEAEQGRSRAPRSSTPPASSASRFAVTRPTSAPSVAVPMLVELVIVTADEIVAKRRPPLPSRIGVVVVVFGLLGLAKGRGASAAAAFGWGLVVASLLADTGVLHRGKPAPSNGALQALQAVGDFMSGKYAIPGTVPPKNA